MEELIQVYNVLNEHLELDTLGSQVKATILSEVDKDLHQLYLLGEIAKGMSSLSRKKRKRSIDPAPPRLFRLEDCPWFVYMSQGRHSDDNSREGKEFRKRFRVPWSFYDDLLKRIRSDDRLSILRTKKDGLGRPGVPMEILVLTCFRLLGRYPLLDELTELTKVSQATICRYFDDFCRMYSDVIYHEVVKVPRTNEDVEKSMYPYKRAGLPGCIASVDCVHIDWDAAPWSMRNLLNNTKNGKSKTMVFQVAVNNKREILSVAGAFHGVMHDSLIARCDTFFQSVMNGAYDHIEYEVYTMENEMRQSKKYRGVWLLVDGGYQKSKPQLQYPTRFSYGNSTYEKWSQWLESIRKDVECTFGILKKRFRILTSGIRNQKEHCVTAIFKTCCALHNQLLEYDGWEFDDSLTDIPDNIHDGAFVGHDDFVDDDSPTGRRYPVPHHPSESGSDDGGDDSSQEDNNVKTLRHCRHLHVKSMLINNYCILKEEGNLVWPRHKKMVKT